MSGYCTNLARSEYPADLPRYWLVTAQIGGSFENEADVVEEVVSGIRFLIEPHGEAEDTVGLGRADDQSAAQSFRRDDIF